MKKSLLKLIDMGVCCQPMDKDEWCGLRLGHEGQCDAKHLFTLDLTQPYGSGLCADCGLSEESGRHFR